MFATLKTYFGRFRWPIFLAMLVQLTIGILAIHVAERVDPSIEGYAAKQLRFAVVAVAGFFAATVIPYPRLGRMSYALFLASLGLLVVVFLFPARNGSQRWIYVPGLPSVSLQPSELAKLAFIVALAWYLRFRSNYRPAAWGSSCRSPSR